MKFSLEVLRSRITATAERIEELQAKMEELWKITGSGKKYGKEHNFSKNFGMCSRGTI